MSKKRYGKHTKGGDATAYKHQRTFFDVKKCQKQAVKQAEHVARQQAKFQLGLFKSTQPVASDIEQTHAETLALQATMLMAALGR